MRTLFFDTETSGFPQTILPASHPSQPILVELGAQLWEDDRQLMSCSLIVRPYNNRTIPPESSRVHGITQERAEQLGVSVVAALKIFHRMLLAADEVVAHNIAFDKQIIEIAYAQAEIGAPVPWPLRMICTMRESAPLAKVAQRRDGSWAWPKLAEAYAIATNRQLENAHTAAADCEACREVLLWLRREGALEKAA